MKTIRKRILLASALLLVLLALLLLVGGRIEENGQSLLSLPRITSRETLLQALNGTPQQYLAEALPASSADSAADFLGILSEGYLSATYVCERSVEESSDDADGISSTSQTWSGDGLADITRQVAQVTLAGSVTLDVSAVRFETKYFLTLDETTCKREALPQLSQGLYYYPMGISDDLGKLRYRVSAVAKGARLTFLAACGNGTITVLPIGNAGPLVVADGSLSDLTYYASATEGSIAALVIFPLFLADVGLWVWTAGAAAKAGWARRKRARADGKASSGHFSKAEDGMN